VQPSEGAFLGQLVAGTSRTDITPKTSISMGGYGQRAGQKSRGVNDPLFAKALYLSDGVARFLMITTDLICIPNEIARAVTGEIATSLEIADHQICLTASHTHSGPETMEFLTRTAEVEEYLEILGGSLVTVAAGAVETAEPCRVKLGSGRVDFPVNRRAAADRDRVDDRTFALLAEASSSGIGRAVLFGCGCHAVTLGHDNYLISADYPGVAQRLIEKELGVENALFFNMAEGNVIPDTRELWDSLDTRGYVGGTFEDAREVGERLAEAVIRSLTRRPFTTELFLASRKGDCVMMPNLHDIDDATVAEELGTCQRTIREYLGEDSLNITPEDLTPLSTLWRDASLKVVEMEMSETEMRRLMTAVCNYFVRLNRLFNPAQRNPIHMPVQVIGLGGFDFLALPGEILVENSFDWQERNRERGARSFVVGLANGFMGYLPHRSNFDEPDARHRYETIMHAMEPAATDVALEVGARLVSEMRREGSGMNPGARS
jgi:hypothetical protein